MKMYAVHGVLNYRFGLFEPEDRCFTTFPSDPLTIPLPNNTYQIYYTPNNTDTSKAVQEIRSTLIKRLVGCTFYRMYGISFIC